MHLSGIMLSYILNFYIILLNCVCCDMYVCMYVCMYVYMWCVCKCVDVCPGAYRCMHTSVHMDVEVEGRS